MSADGRGVLEEAERTGQGFHSCRGARLAVTDARMSGWDEENAEHREDQDRHSTNSLSAPPGDGGHLVGPVRQGNARNGCTTAKSGCEWALAALKLRWVFGLGKVRLGWRVGLGLCPFAGAGGERSGWATMTVGSDRSIDRERTTKTLHPSPGLEYPDRGGMAKTEILI